MKTQTQNPTKRKTWTPAAPLRPHCPPVELEEIQVGPWPGFTAEGKPVLSPRELAARLGMTVAEAASVTAECVRLGLHTSVTPQRLQ